MEGELDKITKQKVLNYLAGSMFPATQDGLLDYAVNGSADPEIIEVLENMPDMTYENFGEFEKALSSRFFEKVE